MENSEKPIIVKKRKPCKCQMCGGKVVPVIYGMPSFEMYQKAEQGEYVLAGCCIPAEPDEIEDWTCWSCHQRYRKE